MTIALLSAVAVTEVLILFKKDGKTLTLKMGIYAYRKEECGDIFVGCGVHPNEFEYKRRLYADSRELARTMLAEVIKYKFEFELKRLPGEWPVTVEKAVTFACKVPTDPDY